MKQTKKLSRKVISYILALVMVFSTMTGIVPGLSVTAYADSIYETYKTNGTLVKIEGVSNVDWYIIDYSDTTVTLFTKECIGGSKFDENGSSNTYENSTVYNYLAAQLEEDGKFASISSAVSEISLLTQDQASRLSKNQKKCTSVTYQGFWWLCSQGYTDKHAYFVGCITGSVQNGQSLDYINVGTELGVRPALKLDLSKVTFDSNNNTFSVGSPKTNQTVTAPTKATGLKYKKDQAQALLTSGASVTTGNTAKDSIQYKVGDEGTWSTEIPTGTNAGTYNVYYKVLEDDTYAEYAPAEPISVTIAKADPETPTGITAKYCDYTGKIKLPDGWTWQDDWYFFETVGTATCKADFAGNDNYNAMTGVDITVAVEKADAAISYEKTEVSVEYGAEFGKNEITNPGDADPTFTSSNESVATVSKTGYVTIKGLGETTITATIEDNEHYHYTTTEASYKLTVNPVTTVVNTAPTATELTYGQKLSESTLTGGAAVSHGSSVAGTFAWKEPDLVPNASESGEYDVVFTPTNTNYAKSTSKVTIKVNKKTVSVEDLEDAQKPVAKTGDDTVYTGEPIELVTAPTADLPLDYEAYYSTDDGDSWSTDIPKKTDPGTYTVKVKYVSKGDNCNVIILDNITATITPVDKKELTDAIAAAKEYYDTIKGNTDYSEAVDKLDKAIEAAEEVAAKNKLTKSEVSTAAEAVTKAKASAETEVKDIDDTKAAQAVIDKINELKPVENIKPEDRTKIEAAREAYKKLSDDQKTKLAGLDSTAVSTLEAAEQALDTAEKAAFDAEKEAEKKVPDALAADGDSDASKKLIEDAKKAIDELAYDETKSLDENKAALAAIVSKLKSDLTDNREAEQKEADDTAAAKKVIDAINALPESDKVATTDKAAIEAARKAYDALTADQKAKVPAETLKKLEEAEAALEAAEKDETDQAAADAVAEKINALPASDKIATTDKAAIEAARKAYDALTDDQKAKVSAETLKKLEEAEKALADAEKNTSDDDKKDEDKPDYKNEWIDGQWYGADGNTEYKAKGSWKQNDKGWWYEDTDGWYPKSQWQKIDGKWYYFTADGYMDYSEYRDGYWLGSDGAWDETYGGGHWMQDSTGWWYVDATGWYPVNRYLWVDGVQYWFNANGYWE